MNSFSTNYNKIGDCCSTQKPENRYIIIILREKKILNEKCKESFLGALNTIKNKNRKLKTFKPLHNLSLKNIKIIVVNNNNQNNNNNKKKTEESFYRIKRKRFPCENGTIFFCIKKTSKKKT